MEKIALYNCETDTVIEIEVPVAEARRARDDVAFATMLMNAALQQENNEEISHGTEANGNSTKVAETETCLYRWSTPCVLLFLETYRSLENKFSNGKYSQKKIWEEISKILKKENYVVTGPQCAAKLRSLKKTYKSIKDHNNKSGNDRRTWPFFEIMDEIFSDKAWCSPVAVASSTGISIKQQEIDCTTLEQDVTSDSGYSDHPSTSKSNIKSLLTKRIRQKEEHEENKNKRHKERMEMDAKFLEALEKLSGKNN